MPAKFFFHETSVKVNLNDHLVVEFAYYMSVSCIMYVLSQVYLWQMYPKLE